MANSSKTDKSYECCSRSIKTSEILKCASCKKKYHFVCVNTSNDYFKDLSLDLLSTWLCPTCNRPRPGADNTNTPIRALSGNDINSGGNYETNRNVTKRHKRKKSQLSDSDSGAPCDLTLEDV
ncbi:jg3141, partial [Pararge aegeria aegeria]